MLSFEGTGKTIEKAIENALFELKAIREDVDIKIIEEGGLFKKARVLVTISDDCISKYQKRRAVIEDAKEEELNVKAMFASVETLSEKKTEKHIEKEEKKAAKEQDKEIKKENKKEAKKDRMSGKDFVKGLLQELKIEAEIYIEETPETISIKVQGGNSGDLIGYRGECLNAIQYVASIIENENSDKRKKLVLDIENYRARREETLKALAHRIEVKVAKTGRSMRLEPMSPNERRIIHTELQTSEKVTTTSRGTEPSRFVIILPKNSQEDNIEEGGDAE